MPNIFIKLIAPLGALIFAATASSASPDVIVLSVDTLRADFLGCYGGAWNISPNIDQIAESALVFDNASCTMPLTAPSFASMFSSQHPRQIGVMRNGMRISEKVPLVAEVFQAAGYHTFAVQSNWTLRGRLSGLDRGFEVYDEDFNQRRWGFYKGERSAEEVTQVALTLLKERPKNKALFAWIHYSDPHAPYRYHGNFSPVKRGLRDLDRRELTRVKYASEVAYMDHYLGKLTEALPPECILLVVADHGESLYEHGYLGHGRNVQQPCIRIPLMIRAPEILPRRSDLPVHGLDIGPTVLALAGLKIPDSMTGCNIFEENCFINRPRIMETYGGAVPRLPGAREIMEHTSPVQQGVQLGEWKQIRFSNRPAALYHLRDDPQELHNRASDEPDMANALDAILDQWNQECRPGVAAPPNLSEEDWEALKSLGYVE